MTRETAGIVAAGVGPLRDALVQARERAIRIAQRGEHQHHGIAGAYRVFVIERS